MATRQNPNAISGLTNKQKWALESKAKLDWKCYYIEREAIYKLQATRRVVGPVIQQIRSGETPDITHLTQMFLDLYDKVGELCDCPVCFETMDKDNTHIPICGHLVCKTCKSNPQLDKCPICRKEW